MSELSCKQPITKRTFELYQFKMDPTLGLISKEKCDALVKENNETSKHLRFFKDSRRSTINKHIAFPLFTRIPIGCIRSVLPSIIHFEFEFSKSQIHKLKQEFLPKVNEKVKYLRAYDVIIGLITAKLLKYIPSLNKLYHVFNLRNRVGGMDNSHIGGFLMTYLVNEIETNDDQYCITGKTHQMLNRVTDRSYFDAKYTTLQHHQVMGNQSKGNGSRRYQINYNMTDFADGTALVWNEWRSFDNHGNSLQFGTKKDPLFFNTPSTIVDKWGLITDAPNGAVRVYLPMSARTAQIMCQNEKEFFKKYDITN
eukprot:52533_1